MGSEHFLKSCMAWHADTTNADYVSRPFSATIQNGKSGVRLHFTCQNSTIKFFTTLYVEIYNIPYLSE